jgi:chromosome segregation ATPase
MMDRVLKALDRELAFLTFQLECAENEVKQAHTERDEAKESLKTSREQVRLTSARAETAERERDALKAQLAAVPATMSRAEWDARKDTLKDGQKYAATLSPAELDKIHEAYQ